MLRFGLVGAILVSLALAPGAGWAVPAGGVGNTWVRSHPFTLMGTSIHASLLDVAEYRAAGLNVLLAFAETTPQTALAAAGGLPWHVHLAPADKGPDAWLKSLVTGAMANAGAQGWVLHDEPSRLQMPGILTAAQWVRGKSPGTLVYGNAFPSYATAAQLYGDASKPGYSWSTYLDDFISIIGPDLLMYDHYPFETTGGTRNTFFSDLMMVRSKALNAKLPYFTFLQAWANAGVNMRLPSESDLRMQAFSHLAAGYSGLAYFIYDYHVGSGGLLDAKGSPTPLHGVAATLNAEILNLGHTLRYLTSTDVRFLPGQHMFLIDNPVPSGLSAWKSGAGGDPHIVGADVNSGSAAHQGKEKSGLIGFFTDDSGKRYFMLVNLSHDPKKTAAAASLPLWVQFNTTVKTLLELDRKTGKTHKIALKQNRLEVTLLGGSGRLYKYDDGPFAPSVGPDPWLDAGVTDASVPPGDARLTDAGTVGDSRLRDGSPRRDGSLLQKDTTQGSSDTEDEGCRCNHIGADSSVPAFPTGVTIVFALVVLLRRRPARPSRTS